MDSRASRAFRRGNRPQVVDVIDRDLEPLLRRSFDDLRRGNGVRLTPNEVSLFPKATTSLPDCSLIRHEALSLQLRCSSVTTKPTYLQLSALLLPRLADGPTPTAQSPPLHLQHSVGEYLFAMIERLVE